MSDRSSSDVQGEVNQLFEGDEPTASCQADKEVEATAEVVVLKGRNHVAA
jgi:hypothetical protein